VVAYLDTYRQIGRAAQAEEPGAAVALDPRPVAFDPQKNRLKRVGTGVSAAFPSPADDYIEDVLDFNEHLVNARHKDATFVMRVSGHIG
jgi:hypothetical protein